MEMKILINSALILSISSCIQVSAYDADSSGVSDIYEAIHGQVLEASADEDFDGYSNYLESLFGSDPLDSKDPGGFDFTISGITAAMNVPSQRGLRYRLESRENLAAGFWEPFGDFIVADGAPGKTVFALDDASASFFRIELAPPLHSDEDGLDDWEEHQLGTDPLLTDTDNDLLDDAVETMQFGSDPHLVDTDGDGYVDYDEYISGSDPDDASAWPSEVLDGAWSRPVNIANRAAPTAAFGEFWSTPVSIQNQSSPLAQYGEYWSPPILIQNQSSPLLQYGEYWSSPILIRNQAFALNTFSGIWSSPVLIRNEF
jgi:hypothetical protein